MGNQTSKKDKDRSRKNVHWKSAEPPLAPGKPYLMPGQPTDEPDVVTIKWQRPRSDNGSTIMGYIVEHRRTGSPHWVHACPQLVQFTELALSGLEPGWRYQFRVIAENAVGKSDPSEASDPLTVTLQRNAISAPRFTIELEDVNGIENEKVEFKVSVIGSPAPQIAWFKDGFEIFSSRRTKIVTENDSSSLIFYQASLTDEGEIKCTATNRAGYAFTKSKLTIEAPPKIRLPRQYEDGLIIEAEEVIRLKVGIAGRPVPSVIWSHNGEMIADGGRYEIENTEKNSQLKITNTNRTDRGEYNLRAINKLGEDNSSFLVTVTARPTQPGKVAIKILLGNTVTLSWAPPEDDGGCKIGNYIVEYFRVGWNVWLKAATCRQLAVTLNDLIAGSEYRFRVKAENPYGLSDPSEESDLLFIPDPKRGINKPLKDQQLLNIDNPMPPVAPKRRNASPSPARTKSNETPERKKPSPIPQIKLNTKIFDDETINQDMAYGASGDFYKFREVPSSSLHEKSGLEEQARQLKSAKNNVKFKIDDDNNDHEREKQEAIYENLKSVQEKIRLTKISSESQTSGKRTYLDLSKSGNDAPSSIQNSSEFMLVLYPHKESKSSDKRDSFDLEMEEYFAPPPPLSQSAPELNAMFPEPPLMRTAVSSTELLYERAMARFYKAVEYEETENARKRSISVEQETRRRSFSTEQDVKRQIDPQEAALTRLRINSLTETERSSVLRRRLSGDSTSLHINMPRRLSFKDDDDENEKTQLNTIRNELNTPEMFERSPSPLAPPMAESEELSDDYTDSTASEDDEEDENVQPRRSRNRKNETNSYHPRMMSPYRQPEISEAAAVLTKPLPPLPDPNFVPKPILKRPASADGRKPAPNKPERKTIATLFGRRSASPSPRPSPRSQRKSVEIDDVPRIIEPREPQEFIETVEKVPEIKIEAPKIPEAKQILPEDKKIVPEVKKIEHDIKKIESEEEIEEEPEPEPIFRPSEQVKQKMLERRQSSLEENRVMADFYGDIIKDITVRPVKPKVPIYLDPEALKQLEIEDEEGQIDSGLTSSADLSPSSTLSRPFSPPTAVQPPRGVSPTIFNRRASERTFSPPPIIDSDFVYGRRLSDTNRIKPNTPLKDNLLSNDRMELNKSPTPQKMFNNGSVLQKHDGIISSTSSIDDSRGRGAVIKQKTGTIPKRRNQSQSRSRDSSCVRSELPCVIKNPMDSTILNRREKSSSRTRNPRSESKSPAAVNRKIIINRVAPPKFISPPKDITPSSHSPTMSSRTATPSEMQEMVQLKVKSTMSYATDVTIFLFATYIYLFKSAILALPILILLLYRQISDKIPDWMKRKKS